MYRRDSVSAGGSFMMREKTTQISRDQRQINLTNDTHMQKGPLLSRQISVRTFHIGEQFRIASFFHMTDF